MRTPDTQDRKGRTPRMDDEWFVLAATVLLGMTGTEQAFAPEGVQPAVGAVHLAKGRNRPSCPHFVEWSVEGSKKFPSDLDRSWCLVHGCLPGVLLRGGA
jgi:hypothetical protein